MGSASAAATAPTSTPQFPHPTPYLAHAVPPLGHVDPHRVPPARLQQLKLARPHDVGLRRGRPPFLPLPHHDVARAHGQRPGGPGGRGGGGGAGGAREEEQAGEARLGRGRRRGWLVAGRRSLDPNTTPSSLLPLTSMNGQSAGSVSAPPGGRRARAPRGARSSVTPVVRLVSRSAVGVRGRRGRASLAVEAAGEREGAAPIGSPGSDGGHRDAVISSPATRGGAEQRRATAVEEEWAGWQAPAALPHLGPHSRRCRSPAAPWRRPEAAALCAGRAWQARRVQRRASRRPPRPHATR